MESGLKVRLKIHLRVEFRGDEVITRHTAGVLLSMEMGWS